MSATATGFAPCGKAARYVQQLVSHWSHKMAASWDASEAGGHAEFPFSDATRAAMDALVAATKAGKAGRIVFLDPVRFYLTSGGLASEQAIVVAPEAPLPGMTQ